MSDADGVMVRMALGAFMLIWETVHAVPSTAVLIIGGLLVGVEGIGMTVRAITAARNGHTPPPPPH